MPDSFAKNIVYLSKAQYQELVTNQSITVDGVTYTYNENDIYVTPQAEPVTDVQVNGTSVVTDGVANVVVASSAQIAVGSSKVPVGASSQALLVYFGLARAANANTTGMSWATVGSYTEDAKSAISEMLGGSVTVTGSTPTIAAKPGISYECGEVVTLDITLPSSGCIDVIFESGSTPTVLTITPPTGYTVEWANGFDATNLEANMIYEINIKMTGTKCLGVAGAWATT